MRPMPRHVILALLPLLASCQAPAPSPMGAIASVPEQQIQRANPDQAATYRIREDLSDVRFLVYRAGPLARLGHNHVIQARVIDGEILLAAGLTASSVHLRLSVAGFQVDSAEARREEGEDFATEPDADAIAGTRRNMLGDKVLDAARYPEILIESKAITGPAWQPDITLRIRLHGIEKELSVPVALELRNDQIVAIASFPIRQTDFGITPLSVLGGGLQVADTLRVRLRLVANLVATKKQPE